MNHQTNKQILNRMTIINHVVKVLFFVKLTFKWSLCHQLHCDWQQGSWIVYWDIPVAIYFLVKLIFQKNIYTISKDCILFSG